MGEEIESKSISTPPDETEKAGTKEVKSTEESTPPETQQSIVDKANEAAARLERANVEHAKLIARQEGMQVKEALGGKAEAGTPAKIETDADYANRVMSGEEDGTKKDA